VAQFSPDSSFIAIGTVDGMLEIQDATTGELIREIQATDSSIYDVGFSNDGTMIAVASEDGTVTLWDVSTLTLQSTYDDLQAPVRTLDYSVNGLLAIAGGQVQVSESRPADNRILIWDAEGQLVQELMGHQASVRTLVFTSDGTQILSGSDDGRIIRWNVETGEQVAIYNAHTDAVWSLAINQDSTQFLSGSRDTTIFLWDIANTTPIATLDAHTTGVRALAFHPNGDFAVSGAGELNTVSSFTDYDLLYWDLEQQAVLRQLPGHTGTIRSLVFNTEGDAILSAGDDGAIIAWHADTLESLIDRIQTKYQVVCLPDETGCVDTSIVASDTSDETDSTDVGFPVQADTVESYAPNSLCVLPPLSITDEGYTPQSLVDTQQFIAEPPYVIGYSHGNVDNTWDDWVLAWAQYQIDQSGETISGFQLRDANGSGPQQVRDLRLLADGGADVIIINPIERAESNMADLEREIEAIVASGIPVVLVGNRTFNPVYTTYVGYDPYEVGCIMAQELTASLDGEGSIAVINGVDVSVADVAYKAGEEAIFNQYGGILLTIEGPTAYNRDAARTQTERQGVAGMIGYNSGITLGAQEGLASQGLAYVPFSSGHSVEIARFADENNLEASLIVRSNQMGATAIETALAILRGEEVSQFIRLVPEVITTDDLDPDELLNAPDNAYLGDWQTLPEEYYPQPDVNTQ
ncbi:MAG: substrate-binding domain-containing protein, partial [Chloroflexota bacterium]